MNASGQSSVPLKIVYSYDDISALIDKFYNKPTFNSQFSTQDFENEFFNIYHSLRERLTIFTDNVFVEGASGGKKGIDLGPIGRDRSIGIVLNDKTIFRPELIHAIWEIVSKFREDYLVYLDGEYEEGSGGFYICIKKDEILGFAAEPKRLRPFGFCITKE